MTEKEMIALNNERRELLNRENEKYYSDMLIYIRLSQVSERAGEELLLELLDHLIEAQKEGKSAQDLYGADPQAYCKQLIEALPKEKLKQQAGFLGFLLLQAAFWPFLIDGLTGLIFPLFSWEQEGSLVPLLLLSVFISFNVLIFLKVMKHTVHAKHPKWIFFGTFTVNTLLMIGFIAGIKYAAFPVIPIPAYLSLLIAGLLFLLQRIEKKRTEV